MSIKPPSPDPKLVPRLHGLTLLQVNLHANPAHNGLKETASFTVAFQQLILSTLIPNRRQVQLHLMITGDETKPELAPYLGTIVAMAEVEFAEDADATLFDMHSAWFSLNPLVGMVRSYLDLFTAVGPFNRLLITPVPNTAVIENAKIVDLTTGQQHLLYPKTEEQETSTK